MHRSTWLVAIALSVSGSACAKSGTQTSTQPLSHRLAGGLGGLWVATPDPQPEGEVRIASQDDQKADLWMKRSTEENPDALPVRQSPRLDYVIRRVTPDSTTTFLRASTQTNARQ